MSILIPKEQLIKLLKVIGIISFVVFAGYLLGILAINPGNIRLLIAASLIFILLAVSIRKPLWSIYLLLLYLPFLGFIRRLLIPLAGWNTLDPLVLVGPVIILLLAFKWFYDKYVHREGIQEDTRLFLMLRWLVFIDVIQIFNPIQGGIFTGFAGVIFYIVPICYMVLSREFIDEKKLMMIFNTVLVIGILSALYGYKQYFYGYSSFEKMWVELSGYTALKVYSEIRPISFFTSASEYACYLGLATVITWVYVLRGSYAGKILGMIGLCVLYSALFIESARGVIVTTTMALAIISIVSARKLTHRLWISLLVAGALSSLFYGFTKLNIENDLIYHSVMGLTDPFGEEATTQGHLELMITGFREGIMNPLGHGLGSTTIAAGKFDGATVSSEIDLSNKFLSTGLLGGLLYLIIMIKVLHAAFKQANSSFIHLAILGILISQGGQWLNGGHYSTVGMIWIVIGYLDKTSVQKRGITVENSLDRPHAQS